MKLIISTGFSTSIGLTLLDISGFHWKRVRHVFDFRFRYLFGIYSSAGGTMTTDSAFVVMQVGSEGSPERRRADEVFEFVVSPALGLKGLKPYRADQDPTPGSITPRLLSEMLESKVVIVDLTGKNPNVYYELGICHAFAKPLVALVDSTTDIAFDVKDERAIPLGEYSDRLTYAQGERAKAALLSSLEVVLRSDYVPTSPLGELATSRSLDDLAPENPLASEIAAIREGITDLSQVMNSLAGSERNAKSLAEDIAHFRRAVTSWLREGAISRTDLRLLTSDTTSSSQDDWVARLTGDSV